MRQLIRYFVVVLLLGMGVLALADSELANKELSSVKGISSGDLLSFDNTQQEKDYNELSYELRCLVCQNQNLEDSNADLAKQLRGKVYDMLQKGKNKEEIKTYMVDRYGDFVLYRPPLKLHTLLLWFGPFLLLLLGLFFLVKVVRHSENEETPLLDTKARTEVQKILEEKK